MKKKLSSEMSTKNLNKYQQANSDSSSELFRLTPINAHSKLLMENRISRYFSITRAFLPFDSEGSGLLEAEKE